MGILSSLNTNYAAFNCWMGYYTQGGRTARFVEFGIKFVHLFPVKCTLYEPSHSLSEEVAAIHMIMCISPSDVVGESNYLLDLCQNG